MNFFFVYDTSICQSDEDDSTDAVVLSFPVQASQSQGHFLCCQLAGVVKFLKSSFSAPSVIGLDQGKFAFMWSGSYLLGLGASSDVHTCVLKDQLSFLCGIFCFYHGNMGNVLKECKNNRYDFLLKLELSWSRYVTLTQCFGNVLQLSLKSLPLKKGKKACSVVANRLLHLCQMSNSVTAGAVFYNSRVLESQFIPQLTNYLSLLSNSNASAPVSDAPSPSTPLPPDVELKSVHLNPKWIQKRPGSRSRWADRHRRTQCSASVGSSRGSDGDVDSGNGSESVWSDVDWRWRGCVKHLDSCITCCSFHERLFEGSVVRSRNRFLGNIRSKKKRDSGVHPSTGNSDHAFAVAVNVLCLSHTSLLSESFLNRSTFPHSNQTTSVDFEFQCLLCRRQSGGINKLGLKKWNSEPYIPQILPVVSCSKSHNDVFLETRHRSMSECSAQNSQTHKVPFQKLRSKSDSRHRNIHAFRRHSKDTRHISTTKSRLSEKDLCLNIEENDLEKRVLYVQRYGGITLVLLLCEKYDEKAINHLWECSFSVLRELECSAGGQESSETPYNIEPSFYILLYNHLQRILKEYPHFPSLLLTEKHSRQTIQIIQEDFKIDAQFLTLCLLSSTYSIFASHSEPNLAFYLQPETNARKLDPLLTLQEKATRRLAKYFKVDISRQDL